MRDTIQKSKSAVVGAGVNAMAVGLGFAGGATFLLKGLKFVYVEHKELAKIYIWPLVIALVVICGGWVYFALEASTFVGMIWPEPAAEAWWGLQHGLWRVFSVILWLVLAAAIALVTFLIFSLLAAPFNDLLSEKIEEINGTWKARPFSLKFLIADVGKTVALESKKIAIKLLWLVPLFLASVIIPVFGQLVYIVLGGYIMAKLLGMDYLDWCMARREWSAAQRFEFSKKVRWPTVGFGTAILLALMVPLAFVVIWPGAVAGGTLLFSHLNSEEKTDSDQ